VKLVAAAIVIAALIAGGVALYISSQHGHHCKQQGFVTSC
jgi:hypothetical protein